MIQLLIFFTLIFGREIESSFPIREFIHKNLHILATKNGVFINGDLISPVINNPKDNYPDLPDSAFDGWRIKKIYQAAIVEPGCCGCKPEYIVDSNFPYAFSKPIILSLSEAGWRRYSLKIQNETSESETLRLQTPEDCDLDSAAMNNQLLLFKDSIVLYKQTKKRTNSIAFSIPTQFNSASYSKSEIDKLQKALTVFDTANAAKPYLAIDPHPVTPMKKVFQIISLINRTRRKNGDYIPFLSSIYICNNPESAK